MADVKDLSIAFFNSLMYFLRNDIAVTTEFSTRTYLLYPDSDLTGYTLPFIGINFYNTVEEFWTQPDEAGTESRMRTFYFTLAVYCDTFAKQRYLPMLVKREIEKETTVEGGITKDGIQIYKGWTGSTPDVGSELTVADTFITGIYPLGGDNEEEVTLKYRSFLDCYYEIAVDKSKVFISTDT